MKKKAFGSLFFVLFFVACSSNEHLTEEETVEERVEEVKGGEAEHQLYSFRDPLTDLYGYINEQGEIVIDPQFNQSFDFTEGLGKVSNSVDGSAKTGFVDEQGKFVIEPIFDFAESFSDGMAGATYHGEERKVGFIDRNGAFVLEIDNRYSAVENFEEDVALIRYSSPENYTMGFVNREGEVIIPPDYNAVGFFSDGRGFVLNDGVQSYFDATGEIVFELSSEMSGCSFSEGVACVRDEKDQWGFMDIDGSMLIEPMYEWASSYSEGLAAVRLDGKWGYINQEAEMVIQPQFTRVNDFSEGLAWVEIDEKWGAINQEGEIVIAPQFDFTLPFEGSLARVYTDDGLEGFVNKAGEIVFRIE